jgi:hypothetical protein
VLKLRGDWQEPTVELKVTKQVEVDDCTLKQPLTVGIEVLYTPGGHI